MSDHRCRSCSRGSNRILHEIRRRGADIIPLTGLTKGQGFDLLKELHAPEQLYLKTPTADLLDHKPLQSDETELGIEYNVLDQYLLGNEVEASVKANIEKRFEITKHKRELPVTPSDTRWKEALFEGKPLRMRRLFY